MLSGSFISPLSSEAPFSSRMDVLVHDAFPYLLIPFSLSSRFILFVENLLFGLRYVLYLFLPVFSALHFYKFAFFTQYFYSSFPLLSMLQIGLFFYPFSLNILD